jgi:hypothetical protein
MISWHWAAKDINDKVYFFEKKPSKDKQLGVWWAKNGEEAYDIENNGVSPLQPVKIIYNHMRRIKDWEQSLINIDPKDWKIK